MKQQRERDAFTGIGKREVEILMPRAGGDSQTACRRERKLKKMKSSTNKNDMKNVSKEEEVEVASGSSRKERKL